MISNKHEGGISWVGSAAVIALNYRNYSLGRKYFKEEGGGVYFEVPRGRIFIRPPSFVRPPPLRGYLQGRGVV